MEMMTQLFRLNRPVARVVFSLLLVGGLVLSAGPTPLALAAPGNDNFASAIDIASLFSTTYTDAAFIDTTSATREAAENTTMSRCSDFPASANTHSVWYRFTATATGFVTLDTQLANYDTVLEVWTGLAPISATISNLDLPSVACNDDAGKGSSRSEATFPVVNGTNYYVMVRDYGTNNVGGNLKLQAFYSADNHIYVDGVNGDDGANTGSQLLPFKTIQRGVNVMIANGFVHVVTTGNYPENVTLNKSLTLTSTVGATATSFTLTNGATLGAGSGGVTAPTVNVNQVGGPGATIPDGISLASSGGTVNVGAGTYTQSVTINKSLTLQSVISGSAIIQPVSGTAVTLTAGTVSLSGFTIQNASTGVLVTGGSGHNITFNNFLANTVGLTNTTGVTVTATPNYWGSASGPTNLTNPGGTGNRVGDQVTFRPWCTTSVPTCTPLAGLATKFAFTTSPGNTQSQATLSPAPVVQAQDAVGNLVATYTGTVTLTLTGGTSGATLTGTTSVLMTRGVVTLTNLSVDYVGVGYRLVISDGVLTGTSSAFNITADRLLFTLSPGNAIAGATTLSATVRARDNFGNTDTTYNGTAALAIQNNPGGGTLAGTTSVAAVNGVITYTGLSINRPGISYTLQATASGLITGTSAGFNISVGPATQVVFTVSPGTSMAGATFTISPVVQAQDAFGNLDAAFTGNISVTIASGTGTAGATLAGTTTLVAVGGVVTYTDLSIDKSGTNYQLTANSTGLTSTDSAAFDITAGPATQLVVTVSPTNTVVMAALSGPTVEARDNLGNLDFSFSGFISITIKAGTGAGGATLGGTISMSASSGVAAFTDLTLDRAGTAYQLVAQSATLVTDTTTAFNIGKGNQTITFFPLLPKVYTDTPFLVTATVNSGLAISYTTAPSSVCTNLGSTVTITGTGTCAVTANQPGNADWNAASPVSRTFTINKAFQTITFGPLANKVYTDTPFNVVATSTSSLTVNFSAIGNCVVTGTLVTITGAGSCTINASQLGDTNFNPALGVAQAFTITKADQIIAFNPSATIPFTTTPVLVTATVNSGLSLTYAAGGNCTNSGGTNAITLTSIGTCTITVTQPGDANFNPALDNVQSFSIVKTTDVINFAPLPDVPFGTPPFPVTATAISGLTVNYFVSGNCTISGNIVSLTGLGSCAVTAIEPFGDSNYNPASPVSQSFNIVQASQIITFPVIPAKTLLDPSFTVTATSSSGLIVNFSYASPGGSCIVVDQGNSSALVVLPGVLGSCAITATQAGNLNYAAASVVHTFNITKAPQTITFGALPNRTSGDAPFTVNATSTSSLPVTFTASGNCTISGNRVTLTGAGSCTITAHQAGDATYAVAPDVPQTFTISSFSRVFLPMMGRNTYGPPDLGVTAFTVNPGNPAAGQAATISIVVKNQGTGPAGPFWVDFYINPATPPTGPNTPWNTTCTLKPCYGIAWFITGGLAAGQSATLTSDPSSYYAANTVWPGYFVSGSNDLYVFIDSWNPPLPTGAVAEFDETNNRAELHGLGVAGPNPASALRVPVPESLPARPARPER